MLTLATHREEISSDSEASCADSKGVRFDSHASMILIPSRQEYGSAGCDLWWKHMDFLWFQRKAVSEIRLLALLQGITVQEAKEKLYQPHCDPDGRCWDFVLSDTPPVSANNSPDPSMYRKSLAKKSAPKKPRMDIEDATPFASTLAASCAMLPDKELEHVAQLHFCVPLTCRVPLSEKERPSRKQKRGDPQSWRMLVLCLLTLTLCWFLFFSSSSPRIVSHV